MNGGSGSSGRGLDGGPRLEGGGILSVVGPDGSGKTTLIDALVEDVLGGRQVMRIRTVGTLPRRTAPGIAVTEPHGKRAYSVPLSIAKTAYIYADYVLGWMLRIKPFARKGGWVVIERGWWDIAVDPRRYRMNLPARLLWALGRTLPSPDLLLVLDAPAEVIYARKTELTVAELERQRETWRTELPRRQKRVYLDASAPAGEVLRRAEEEIHALSAHGAGSRPGSAGPLTGKGAAGAPQVREESAAGTTDLPSSARPRWTLPRGPRPVARAALRVYHPVTLKGLAGWRLADVVAGLGGFRLLPVGNPLPEPVIESLEPHLSQDTSIAVASTNHAGRFIALLIGVGGSLQAAAKIATDDPGRMALAEEAAKIQLFGAELGPPLSAPRVLVQEDGLLLLEAVSWKTRIRVWRLPQEVARALGTFYGAGPEGRVHGDFAPWNLLRTTDGWVLIDWEEANHNGRAFGDVFHYVVQAHALLGRPAAEEVLSGLRGEGWVGAVFAAFATSAELDPFEASEHFGPYLESSRVMLDPATLDGAVGLRARDSLAGRLTG